MAVLAAFGSNCIDLYHTEAGDIAYCGGGPVNMAIAAKGCGVNALYIGAVGDDAYGKKQIEAMKAHGIDTSHVTIQKGRTAVSEVTLSGNERILGDYDAGVLEDYRMSENEMRIAAAADLCVMDLWGMQEDAFSRLKQYGALTAFDAADRPYDPVSQKVMPYTDLFFFSHDGTKEEAMAILQDLSARGIPLAVCMRGEEGSLARDKDGLHMCGIVRCEDVVDTMGAGDSYIGAFLAWYMNGKPVEECMRKGAASAAGVLGCHGAFAGGRIQ